MPSLKDDQGMSHERLLTELRSTKALERSGILTWSLQSQITKCGDFPGLLVVKNPTACFQCAQHEFDPWPGNQDPPSCAVGCGRKSISPKGFQMAGTKPRLS